MRIKITVTVLVLFVFVLFTNAQSEFKTSTSNTYWPALDLSTLYYNPEKIDNWRVEGELNPVPGKVYFLLYNDESLVSSIIHGSECQSLDVVLELKTEGGFNSSTGNYFVSIEYEDGTTELNETTVSASVKEPTNFFISFKDLKPLDFVIRIKGQTVRGQTAMVTVMSSIMVNVTYRCKPMVAVEKAGLKIFKDTNYDNLIVNIEHQEKSNFDVDTLYYNDFDDNDLKGAIAYPNAKVSYGYCYLNSTQIVKMQFPISINGINDDIFFSFKHRKNNVVYNDTIKLFLNGKLVDNIYNNSVWSEYSVTLVSENAVCNIELVCDDTEKTNSMSLDDILIYQKSKYRYVSLPSFPKTTDGDISVDGLYCNDEYRIQMQYTKDSNEYGEEVVTNIVDTCVVTLGDYHEISSDESYILDEDYEGTLLMYSGASLEGNFRIMGELCYVLDYRSGEWESIGCPFKPYLIGAFVDGEPYYLRENIDFHLQQYIESIDHSNSYFDNVSEFEAYKGYIIKIPKDITYDNNQLFIFSEKGVEINMKKDFSYDKLYTHVCNPYTYQISTDAWTVFNADCLYKYDGTVYRLFTSNDIIQPFESIIVYNGGLNSAPKVIKLDNTNHIDSLNDEIFISVYNNSFVVNNYAGRICVYDINGIQVFNRDITFGEKIVLSHGIYIINIDHEYKKIIL